MKQRLFIAIPLSQEIRGAFANCVHTDIDKGIKWVDPENIHITVVFIGDTDEDQLENIKQELAGVINQHQLFYLSFDAITLAPPGKRDPHMIWGQFKQSKEFDKLVDEINQAVAKHHQDFVIDQRRSIPHATLTRFKGRIDIKQIELTQPEVDRVEVNSIDLMESELTEKGPIYTIVESYNIPPSLG